MDFFGIGPLELLVILVVALLVVGPDRLPSLANRLGQVLYAARKAIAEAKETMSVDLDMNERKPQGRDPGQSTAAPPDHLAAPPSQDVRQPSQGE